MQSLTGFFLSKYGMAHKVLLVLWLNLPFMGLMLLTYPYSEFFWYPYWWLNLQTAWLAYCCFEDGLTLLVDQVVWIEFFFLLVAAFFLDYSNTDERAMRERYDCIWALLESDDTLKRTDIPMSVGFSENDTRIYFDILVRVSGQPESCSAERMRKFRRLAMLYSLPMSFRPMLRRRLFLLCIVSVVATSFWCVWYMSKSYSVNNHRDELRARLSSKSK